MEEIQLSPVDMINLPTIIINEGFKNIQTRWLFVWDFEKPSNQSRSPPRSASSLISKLRSFSFNKEFTSNVNSPGGSFGGEDCHPKKHPSFLISRGRVVSFLEKGIWRRDSFEDSSDPLFCSHTYPGLCWMEVVQMAVLGDIRKLIFHWSMIGPFTGHPNLLELNQKKQPDSKLAAFKLHGSHS